ncbi:hypothetical protein ACF0H5_023063 [Mactra antiquata]
MANEGAWLHVKMANEGGCICLPSSKDSKVGLLILSGKDSKVRLLIPSGKDVTIQACHYVFTVKVEQIYRYSVAELSCHV